jgi:D-serine deaminase-like pyridoxal phosphate-dependent protein
LAAAASAKDISLRVLIEVDVGMGRCGVTPGKAALALAQVIVARPSLRFEGMMGYEGHAVMIPDLAERRRVAEEAMASLIATCDLIEKAGIPVPIVSGGGTGTYAITGRYPGVTEIQAGSYLTMDSRYHREVGMTEFGCALTLLATVATVIHTHGQRAIVDAGMKCLTREFGLPVVAHPAGWKAIGLSEEHGALERVGGPGLQVGDKVEIVPSHGCTTINLHDQFHVLRRGTLEAIWPIAGRGKSA